MQHFLGNLRNGHDLLVLSGSVSAVIDRLILNSVQATSHHHYRHYINVICFETHNRDCSACVCASVSVQSTSQMIDTRRSAIVTSQMINTRRSAIVDRLMCCSASVHWFIVVYWQFQHHSDHTAPSR